MKETNTNENGNNNSTVEEEPMGKEVFKEAFRKFSTTSQQQQPSSFERKFKRGEKDVSSSTSSSSASQLPDPIRLNEEGKEEFCIKFEKVPFILKSNLESFNPHIFLV
jgi:hypothetical protein